MQTLLAQADISTYIAAVGPVIQLVQLGGFGALVWFFVWKRMPDVEKQFAAERESWLKYMRERDAKFEALIERTIKCIEESNARRS